MGDIAAQKARAQRLEELSKDPVKGDKITPASQREAEIALQLEENGQLASPIVRDPSGNAEFIDGEGIYSRFADSGRQLGRMVVN